MIADRRDLQRMEHAVARILAETEQPVEAYAAVLEAIGASLGWELGAVWEVDRTTASSAASARGTPAPGPASSRR